jgi:hypothetical protein
MDGDILSADLCFTHEYFRTVSNPPYTYHIFIPRR